MKTPQPALSIVDVLLAKQDGRCWLCDGVMNLDDRFSRFYRSIDHYVPISRGGSHSISNKRLACVFCNSERGNPMPTDASPDQLAPLTSDSAEERRVRRFLMHPWGNPDRKPKKSVKMKSLKKVIKLPYSPGEGDRAMKRYFGDVIEETFGPQRGLGREDWDRM